MATQTVTYYANDNLGDIDSVAIYHKTNEAVVTRKIKVGLKGGQNKVEIRCLPTSCKASSHDRRVDISGNATIVEHTLHLTPHDYTGKSSLHKRQDEVVNNIKTIKGFKYQSSENSGMAKILERDLEVIRRDIAQVAANLSISVSSRGAGEVELSVTYTLPNASWTPRYSLSAEIAPTGDQPPLVYLDYMAAVSQETGEDWKDVTVKVGTAKELDGGIIPSLIPYFIGPQAHGYVGPEKSTGINATFELASKWNIKSCHRSPAMLSGKLIAKIDLCPVAIGWTTVPKNSRDVFIPCKVKNTSGYPLLPGDAAIYRNEELVRNSPLPPFLIGLREKLLRPQESFICSLGVDPSVRITYHPHIETVSGHGSFNGFSGKSSTSTFIQRITIENQKLTSIAPLVVKDQVPVSNDARVKITVLEPSDLLQDRDGTLVESHSNVWARWVNCAGVGESGDMPTYQSAKGLLEWVCEIGPATTMDLTLAWEVNAPVGLMWAGASV
ncbi:hypothetical protein BD410DRAFT_832567 [Rickenella mellea]|uniref:DUF4139 domain-containing protein n=1 Tax=Rickenella mellea TaxID=50990 RepID=A0A4Y7PLU2_9AGAM|nr:hypothetical protein BD410DRAFT_832567 [Rickenella mellea]